MMKFFMLFSMALLSLASSVPILVEDEKGQQYYLSPVVKENVLSRHRREEPRLPGPDEPKGSAEYGANEQSQGGKFAVKNPDGSGFTIKHSHANGMGHTWGVDASVPVHTGRNALGDYSINLGAGFDHPGMDRRISAGFNQRF